MLTVALLLILAGFMVETIESISDAYHYYRNGLPKDDEET